MSSNGESSDCTKDTQFFSSKDKGILCRTCHKEFPDFNSIIDHHCLPFECKQCLQKFEYQFKLKFHDCYNKGLKGTKPNLFKCSYCNSTFVTLSLFELHESSCSEKIKICDHCKRSSPYKCSCNKSKKRLNGSFSSCNDNAFCEKTSIAESSKSICNDASDKHLVTDINSKLMDDGIMDNEETKKSLDSQLQVNKHPSNLNNSNKKKPARSIKPKLHFSGKFKNLKRIKNNPLPEISKTCDETVKKNKPKTKKLSAVKKKAQNAKVLDEEMSDITTESSNTTVFSDNTAPECDMSTNEEVTGGEMIVEKCNLKDAASLKVILTDVNLHKEKIVENCEKYPQKDKADSSIMKNFAEKSKHTLESTFNITFNGIHSSHSSVKKTKPKKPTIASSKSSKKRKADIATHNATTDSQISEKGESDRSSNHSSRESSPAKRKIRKSRSSSREHDSGLESGESRESSSSMPANSDTLKINNPTKTKKISSSDSEIGSSLQESNSLQQNHRKDDARKKSIVNDSNKAKSPQHMPLELEVSESTLNDIPEDSDGKKVYHPRQRGEFYVKGKRFLTRKLKTENNIEFGDLLNTLPARSGILLKASPGSFHSYRCPKCNKLFKHLKTGTKHLISCRAKFKKNILIAFNEIIYVCTSCHFTSTRKVELTNHRVLCTPDSISDIILNYNYVNKQFTCPTCSFSCLSRQMYKVHPCTERLERMKTCIVNIKKIDPEELHLSDGTTIILDPIKYEAPDGAYLPQVAAVKAQIFTGVGNAFSQKGKKFFVKNAEKCNTVDDLMKNVVKPVTQLNTALGTKNACPDLDLDVTLSYESQKLVAEAAEKYLSANKSNTCNEVFRIETPFDNDDSNDSNPDPQVQKLIADLHNYRCKCKKPQFDAEIENKPCVPCLNDFVKTHFLSGVDLNPPTQDSEPSTSTASTSEVTNSNFQQEISVQASANSSSSLHISNSSCLSNNSSVNISSDNSSNIPVSDNIASIPEERAMPTISSVVSNSSPTSDSTATPNAETLLQSLISILSGNELTSTANAVNSPQEPKQSNNSEPTASHSGELDAAVCDDDKRASPDQFPAESNKILDYVEKCCEGISDNETPSRNGETFVSLDGPSVDNVKLDNNPNGQQLVSTNSEASKSLPHANSEENESLLSANSVQTESQPELNESDLPTSSSNHHVNSCFQKGEFTFAYLQTDCTVFSSELKMTVTTLRDIQSDLSSKQFQDILIDLLTKLKLITSVFGNDNSIFERALDIICENKLNFVDIQYKSVHLYIHLSFEDSVEYSAYILKSSGQYVCSECNGNFSPSGLIGHIIQEHNERNIYISIID